LIESSLTENQLKKAVEMAISDENIRLRDYFSNFVDALGKAGVPLLIFSAGIEDILVSVIELQTGKEIPSHVFTSSNKCIFHETTGKLIGFEEPVFHVFNKMFSSLKASSYSSSKYLVEDVRPNILLLGDSLGDLNMSKGLNCEDDRIIRVGFLQGIGVSERLKSYLQVKVGRGILVPLIPAANTSLSNFLLELTTLSTLGSRRAMIW
jgi:5'-nucleotidase